MDDIDAAILRILQMDASLSLDALSDRVSLSRNACWRRIKQMEESGIIRGRVALLDPAKIGLGLTVFVLVKTSEHSPEWIDKFNRAIAALPEVIGAHRMAGDLDYILRVRVPDVAGYDAFYQRLIARVPVADVSASFVMDDLKDTTVLPV